MSADNRTAEDRSDELIEVVSKMAEVMPRELSILDCATELLDSQAVDPDTGERRSVEQQLMMTMAAYAAALRIIQQLTPEQTYSLAEIRNGTGWPKGVRFAAIQE